MIVMCFFNRASRLRGKAGRHLIRWGIGGNKKLWLRVEKQGDCEGSAPSRDRWFCWGEGDRTQKKAEKNQKKLALISGFATVVLLFRKSSKNSVKENC